MSPKKFKEQLLCDEVNTLVKHKSESFLDFRTPNRNHKAKTDRLHIHVL